MSERVSECEQERERGVVEIDVEIEREIYDRSIIVARELLVESVSENDEAVG